MLKINAKTGKILHSFPMESPVRSHPVILKNYAYLLNINNQIEVINHKTGGLFWAHSGISEPINLLGGGVPAVCEDFVIVNYSSGEMNALHPYTGSVLWSSSTGEDFFRKSFDSINHIRSNLLIHGKFIYLISSASLTKCIDAFSGEIIWQIDAGSTNNGAISGKYLFLVNDNGNILCINNQSGKIYWVKGITDDVDKNKEREIYTSPILVNNMVLTASSSGNIFFNSVKNGLLIKQIKVNEKISVNPVVIRKKILVLTDKGNLIAFQ